MPSSKGLHSVKFILSLLLLVYFIYMMVYADKFDKAENKVVVNSQFVSTTTPDVATIDVSSIASVDTDQGAVIEYVVQPGDTLGKIASQFSTTVKQIQDINDLSSPIHAGQTLLITNEAQGFIYQIPAPINVKVFADTYSVNLDDFMTLNGIQDPTEVLQNDQEVFVNMTEEQAYQAGLLARPIPKPIVTHRPTPAKSNIKRNAIVTNIDDPAQRTSVKKGGNILDSRVFNKKISNRFALGHCTWYVAAITPEMFPYVDENTQYRPFGGNANERYGNAKKAGFSVGQTPRVGSIIVYAKGFRWRSAGHVGKVVAYDADGGTMTIQEMNWLGLYIADKRQESVDNDNILGYIYPSKTPVKVPDNQ